MGLAKIVRDLLAHPLNRDQKLAALSRFVRWQFGSRLLPGAVALPFIGKSRLLVSRGMTGATGNIYSGLHDFEEMSLVLHCLRKEDLFLDIGANVGAFTVLAAAVAGARVVSFEPVPSTFARLLDNIRLNDISALVDAQNVALGAKEGSVNFTTSLDTVNHVLADAENQDAASVKMFRLDDIVGGASPTLIKIDVEGFESEVVAGGERTFGAPSVLAVIMELNGSGSRYGFDEQKLKQKMLDFGFEPKRYDPRRRLLSALAGDNGDAAPNHLFVRNIDQLQTRLQTASAFDVGGRRI